MRGSLIKDIFEEKQITVYIPPSCGAWNVTFPLLFAQDGAYLFEDNVEALERKFADGSLPEMIIAGVTPNNRLDEYTPWPARALVDSRPDFGGQGDAYIRFLGERLKPYLESNYYADGSREQTGIIGGSLGGLISLYAGSTRPELFSKLGLLSASFWYEGMMDFVHQKASELGASDCRIYMSIGTREGSGKETVQKNMVALTRQVADTLRVSGVTRDRLQVTETEGAVHAPPCFAERFPEAVEWLFGTYAGRTISLDPPLTEGLKRG